MFSLKDKVALITGSSRGLGYLLAREFAERELVPLAARWDENEEFPWDSVAALKSMDLMGASLPGEYGGQGLSYAELSIIHEEIARVCMTTSTTYLTHLSLSSESVRVKS